MRGGLRAPSSFTCLHLAGKPDYVPYRKRGGVDMYIGGGVLALILLIIILVLLF